MMTIPDRHLGVMPHVDMSAPSGTRSGHQLAPEQSIRRARGRKRAPRSRCSTSTLCRAYGTARQALPLDRIPTVLEYANSVGQVMSGARDRRRQSMIDEVVNAAWELVHEHGLAGLSMRELGERVGLHASSIYQYFPSKLDIYDALFAHGHRELQTAMADLGRNGDPVSVFRTGSAMFTAFCTEDPIRYQLLFQRTIPDFQPSATSMALASESYQGMASALWALGIVDAPDLDLWTAVQTGIADQQIANDPGGQRWSSQLDRAIDMFLAFVKTRPPRRKV